MTAPKNDEAGIRQTIRVLRAGGWELDYIDDHEETEEVHTESQAVKLITDLDDAFLAVKKGEETGWVRFVLGNEPDEVICDHTLNLSEWLDPMTNEWYRI